MTWKGIHPEYS